MSPLSAIAPTTTSGAPAAPAADPKLHAAAEAFEAVYARQMIGAMRNASLGEDLLGSSAGTQFRDMLDARTADALAAKGGLGIAALLVSQWSEDRQP